MESLSSLTSRHAVGGANSMSFMNEQEDLLGDQSHGERAGLKLWAMG